MMTYVLAGIGLALIVGDGVDRWVIVARRRRGGDRQAPDERYHLSALLTEPVSLRALAFRYEG